MVCGLAVPYLWLALGAAGCSSDDPGPLPPGDPYAFWYEDQLVDHFDDANDSTWKQRYYVNDTHFDGTGPVFLCVGGEGPPLTSETVVTGAQHCAVMVSLAKEVGGLIVAVQHRFYGKSAPAPTLSTENLQWLSAPQALADIARLHDVLADDYDLSDANRWVSFGGSYPGMLAAWLRTQYPELFHAAVSSSAPVQARVNMQGYANVMGRSLAAPIVGGSDACVEVFGTAFATFGQDVGTQESRETLYTDFNICTSDADPDPLTNTNNQFQLLDDLMDTYPIQSNDPNCTEDACNIQKSCDDYMLNATHGEPLERLAALFEVNAGEDCTSVDYQEESIAPLEDISLDAGPWPIRSWLYQTCAEFGFYQTCDPDTECPFTKVPHINNVNVSVAQCETLFGMDAAQVQANVDATNAFFGGWDVPGTRILSVSGSIDPWHSLSLCRAPDCPAPAGQAALWVDGASHHFWTHAPGFYVPPLAEPVAAAQEAIKLQVVEWLDE
ncbi:MAG: S28 family serine protease [bacterium]